MDRVRSSFLWICAATLASGCNCEGSKVGTLSSGIEVTPTAIDFGDVPKGVHVQSSLTIHNVGDLAVKITRMQVRGSAIFTVTGTPAFTIAAQNSVPRVIEATATELGLFEGTLLVSSDLPDTQPIEVTLRLNSIEPPPCDDGNLCTTDTFDTTTAACTHVFADGTPCQPADKCIINAVCSRGVCLGESKTCSDQSACTRDLCRQIDGVCVFRPDETNCDDGNPCTADGCGVDGCTHDFMPAGSPCDDHDACTRGDACFGGVCTGSGAPDGTTCDDGDSCTTGDECRNGTCTGTSILAHRAEGERLFEFPLSQWDGAFVHRREVSLSDDGIFFGMDHLPLVDPVGLTHLIFTVKQCGTPDYVFSYDPPDSHVFVSYVRREMQLEPDNRLRIVVGIRQTRTDGFLPQTTTYLLDPHGQIEFSRIQTLGGETGRSLLPDGSHIFGVVVPLETTRIPDNVEAHQNLVVVREDRDGNVLWRHERTSDPWAEFLGTAGPRVLFWAKNSWGALDFNTGQLVWSSPTPFITDQMALSTSLNLGLARVNETGIFGFPIPTQLVGVEILEGRQVFIFPAEEDDTYVPRTDPVIAADGRIIMLMQHSDVGPPARGTGLDFVELAADGTLLSTTPLPYTFPDAWVDTRSRDQTDDPFPTVADDGVTYVGYGDRFWAIDPGGQIRWTLTSTMPDAFTATVPLLRDDGVMLINEGSRKIIGVRTNGGKMSVEGWASFRHDGRRTNYTP